MFAIVGTSNYTYSNLILIYISEQMEECPLSGRGS
jgi:hypothetical protein